MGTQTHSSQGISDTPAWLVSKANMYARLMGKTPFVIYQGAWSILQRDFERDIIPMARTEGTVSPQGYADTLLTNYEGLALAPFNVLAGGRIRTDEEEERRRQTGELGRTISRPDWERTESEKKLCKALEDVAQQVGAKSIQAVAIAYVMQKTPYVFPVIGCRKVEQLEANIEALDVSLSPEQIKYLENVLPFDPGFPHGMVVSAGAGVSWDADEELTVSVSPSGRRFGVHPHDAVGWEVRQVAACAGDPAVLRCCDVCSKTKHIMAV